MSVTVEVLPGHSVTLTLLSGVENLKEVKNKVIKQELDAVLLGVHLVAGVTQVLTAVARALMCQQRAIMTTRSISTEIIYSLSPSRNISESLKRFGVGDKDTSTLALILDDTDGSKLAALLASTRGQEQLSLDQLATLSDEVAIRKMYKVGEQELTVGTLEEALVCRIASQDCVR